MNERFRRIAYSIRAGLFTIVIHGVLIAALVAGLWWPFSENKVERGSVKPIQAQAISSQDITEVVKQQENEQKKKQEEKQRVAEELEALKKQQEEEKKKLEELEVQRKKQEEDKIELEKQKKLEEEKKKQEEEKKRKEAEEKKKKEAEKKKLEEEKKKKEEEKKRKEAEKKRLEEEKRKKEAEAQAKRENELQEQLQRERNQTEAANALTALVDRIATAIENNWRRPLNSTQGLQATILVKVGRNGEVLSANVVKSSGDQYFDQSAEIAVQKASPLPFPTDPKYYEFINEFNLLFNPDDY